MDVSPAKINVESQLKISYNILASPYLIRTILMCFQSPCERNPCLNGGQCLPNQDSVELTLRRKVNNHVDCKFGKEIELLLEMACKNKDNFCTATSAALIQYLGV